MTSNENISVSTANNNSPLIDKLIKIKKKFTPETILPDKSRNWIFNAGNYFSGNPKWLFIYINKYRKDINAVWMSESEETAKYVRSLGYEAYQIDSDKAIEIQKKSGVFVVENVKEVIPTALQNATMLNLFHGVGCKSIERKVTYGFLNERIAKKYIKNNLFYKNNQLFLVTSPLMEEHFKAQCGIDDDKVIRAGYPRCIYQKYNQHISTFDHDIKKLKGMPQDCKIAVYAPTYRDSSPFDFFGKAVPDIEILIEKLKQNNMMLIFKMHPFMENDHQYVQMKEYYSNCPNLLFWDNQHDIYEIFDKIDLAVIDYSSIFYDMLAGGVKHFIRYIFDYNEENSIRDLVFDYKEMTFGRICDNFDSLIAALDNYQEDSYPEEEKRINDLFWKYSDENTFENIINRTLEFKPDTERELPKLYSFDIFDTLISRKCLAPEGIFYYVKDKMLNSDIKFPQHLINNYPNIRQQAEANVRDFYSKTLNLREDERREIRFDEILNRIAVLHNLDEKQIEALKNWELEAEFNNCIPLMDKIGFVEHLVNSGETVVLISDMYLDKEFIKKMLMKVNTTIANLPIFLSSEYGIQKTTRKLFLEVYKSFPEYNFSQWTHYGDNQIADVQRPRQLGIRAISHKPPEFNEYEQNLVDSAQCYDAYLIAANMARYRHGNISTINYFAYAYVSLYFVPYISWAVKDAMSKGIQCLYFISRDGHHLKRIADAIIEHKGYNIKTKYIYGSRKVWRIPSFVNEIDKEFFLGFGNFSEVRTYPNLLKALNMDSKTFEKMFPELQHVSTLPEFDNTLLQMMITRFKTSEKYHSYLLKKSKESRVIISDYFKQEIDFSEKFAFVEYWGRGYTQECHARIMQDVAKSEIDIPYYYVRSIYPTDGHIIRNNFTSNTGQLLFAEAIFANIPYKSITEYKYNRDGTVSPVIVPQECNMQLHRALETCLIKFCNDYAECEFLNENEAESTLFNFALSYFTNHQDDMIFAECLAPLVDSVGTYGELREFAPAADEAMIKKLENGEKVSNLTRSAEMTLNRSSEKMAKEFERVTIELPMQIAEQKELEKLKNKDRVKSIKKDFKDKDLKQLHYDTKRYAKWQQRDYNKFCKNPVNQKRVIFLGCRSSATNAEFMSLNKQLQKIKGIEIIDIPQLIKRKRYNADELKLIASAKYIIISKQIDFITFVKLRKETKVIQLWKTAFPFETFGLVKNLNNLTPADKALTKKRMSTHYDMVITSSEALKPVYNKAFDIPLNRIYNTGCCSTDIYFDKNFRRESLNNIYEAFPAAKNKKIILYMPLHRFTPLPEKQFKFLDIAELYKYLKDDYVIIYHTNTSKVEEKYYFADKFNSFAADLTGIIPLRQLMASADCIVGDYRNGIFESTVMDTPIFLTVDDLDDFNDTHETNFDYNSIMPGVPICDAFDLIHRLKHIDKYDYTNLRKFRDTYLTDCDGKAAERIVSLMYN